MNNIDFDKERWNQRVACGGGAQWRAAAVRGDALDQRTNNKSANNCCKKSTHQNTSAQMK